MDDKMDVKDEIEKIKTQVEDLSLRNSALLVGQQNILPAAIKPRHLASPLAVAKGDMYYHDGNGNFIRLAAGTVGQYLSFSTVPQWQTRASYQATPADPTGTTNTTGLMMGLAGAITPNVTGKVLIHISGDIASDTSGDGANVQIRTGTGTAPANAAALTGTAAGGLVKFVAAANAQKAPFSLSAIVSGLTISTAIWIDVGLAAVTGGTATIKDISISAIEV